MFKNNVTILVFYLLNYYDIWMMNDECFPYNGFNFVGMKGKVVLHLKLNNNGVSRLKMVNNIWVVVTICVCVCVYVF
jgi:hypothetical protein